MARVWLSQPTVDHAARPRLLATTHLHPGAWNQHYALLACLYSGCRRGLLAACGSGGPGRRTPLLPLTSRSTAPISPAPSPTHSSDTDGSDRLPAPGTSAIRPAVRHRRHRSPHTYAGGRHLQREAHRHRQRRRQPASKTKPVTVTAGGAGRAGGLHRAVQRPRPAPSPTPAPPRRAARPRPGTSATAPRPAPPRTRDRALHVSAIDHLHDHPGRHQRTASAARPRNRSRVQPGATPHLQRQRLHPGARPEGHGGRDPRVHDCQVHGNTFVITAPAVDTLFTDGCFAPVAPDPAARSTLNSGAAYDAGTAARRRGADRCRAARPPRSSR